jgi:hypothetical protein
MHAQCLKMCLAHSEYLLWYRLSIPNNNNKKKKKPSKVQMLQKQKLFVYQHNRQTILNFGAFQILDFCFRDTEPVKTMQIPQNGRLLHQE